MVPHSIIPYLFFPSRLSRAHFCFTKLFRPLIRSWWFKGHLSFVFLDDGLGSQPDKISTHEVSITQRQAQRACGLLCN